MPTSDRFEQQIEEMRLDMREMRGAITKMADALTKLSVVEERNFVTMQNVEKLVSKVERLDDKVASNELEQAKFVAEVGGITKTMRVMWVAFGGGVLYLGGELFSFLMHLPK